MLRGVFIGIDRYKPPVNRLACAGADARALGALFEDTLGGDVQVLTDQHATRSEIVRLLTELQRADPDDLIVVSFAGHGTEDHYLVPVDVDPGSVASTCISLDELAGLLDAIPARHLLVVLDCCFSGGFGGACVFAPTTSRSMTEDRSSVEALVRGEGRIVITASGAGEPALETVALGHGLFTSNLVEALQGPGDLEVDGRIDLLRLLSYVVDRVVAQAERMGEVQTPTIYGSISGAPSLAALTPGARYAEAFPDRVRLPATSEWQSLLRFGFKQEPLDAWSASMPCINDLQLEAINKFGVLDGRSVLVIAPTGAGKTLIGEFAALRAVADHARAVILLPLKALVNDKYEYLTRTYGGDISVVRATGDNGDEVPAILQGQYDIALLTYEKFMSLALGNSYVLRGVSVVIVDEVQVIADPGRGPALEFLLTLLRSGHGRGDPVQIVALSAVIGATHGLESWLGGDLLRSEVRPVPLRENVLDQAGSARTLEPDGSETVRHGLAFPEVHGGSASSKPWIISLVRRLVADGKKVIVFRSFKGDTVGTARYLADALGLPPATDTIRRLPDGDRSTASEDLRHALAGGVGFHNADLDRDERLALETDFRDPTSPLRVLAATTTLAMGINTPAEAVVIAGLKHPQNRPFSVAEYKNMAGRAGRPGHSEAGESFIVATSARDVTPAGAWNHYVLGRPEDVESHFLAAGTDPRTLILRSLVALDATVDENGLVALLENSFAVWRQTQAGLPGWDRQALARDLVELVQASLLDREPDGRLTLTALGRYAGESGIEVQSITNVVSALRGAPHQLTVPDIVALAQVTRELDGTYIPSNLKARAEQWKWSSELVAAGVSQPLVGMLHVGGGNPASRSKRALACLLFIGDRPMVDIERHLLQHTIETSAAGNIRNVATRTRDVLDAVSRVAEFRGHSLAAEIEDDHLAVRLEYGLPDAVASLALKLGTLVSRGQYLTLLRAGVTDAAAAASAPLANLLGDRTAALVAARLSA